MICWGVGEGRRSFIPRPLSLVYRNDGNGVFQDIGAGLSGVYSSAAAWGDYDNDGDLDIVLAGRQAAGRHRVIWDGRDEAGARLGSGIYLVRMSAGEQISTRKLVLAR